MAMERLVGMQLGKHEPRTEIGGGKIKVVYAGYDRWLERWVVAKVLASYLA